MDGVGTELDSDTPRWVSPGHIKTSARRKRRVTNIRDCGEAQKTCCNHFSSWELQSDTVNYTLHNTVFE